jgi:uncharacterized phage protein (TIGR01671 family)
MTKPNRFKFRAWDTENKRWIKPWEIFGDWGGTVHTGAASENGKEFCLHSNEYLIWVQSTGLLDKNGKEIFEGDVLKHTWENEKHTCNEKVEWNKNGYWSITEEEINENGFFEIIGNIYKNPELLK